jgi:hypothetical protein
MTNARDVLLAVGALCGALALAVPVVGQAQAPLFDQSTYPLAGISSVRDIDVADVNGDDVADIGVLCFAVGFGDAYRVLFGRGDGTFFPPVSSPLGATQIWKATLADVSGDGKADRLLVGTHDNVHVQLSQGDGQFTTLAVYPIGCAPWEVHVVDLNGDQLPDMVTSFGDHLVCDVGFTTYLGDGLGHFEFKYKATAQVIADMTALAPADLDRDDDIDLAGASSSGSLCRFVGFGNGAFGPTVPLGFGSSADVADLDENGWLDLVSVLPSGIQAYLGTGQGALAPVIVSPVPPVLYDTTTADPHLALGDLNADGRVDAAGAKNGELMISLGLGTGAFEPAAPVPDVVASRVRAADVSDDGSVDLVAASAGNILVLLNLRPAWPWTTVAPGLPAAGLAAPKLSTVGSLVAGQIVTLSLAGGASGAPAVLVAGPDRINAPFKGGVLVPLPALLLPLTLDAGGGFDLSAPLPTPLPSGVRLYLQAWIVDPAGPVGFTSSNAVVGTAP